MSDIRMELERLKKDMAGLTEISADLKDQVEELTEKNIELEAKLKKAPKGLSSATMAKLRKLEEAVSIIKKEHLLDRQQVTNNLTAMLGLTKEFQQTVAANDHH